MIVAILQIRRVSREVFSGLITKNEVFKCFVYVIRKKVRLPENQEQNPNENNTLSASELVRLAYKLYTEK